MVGRFILKIVNVKHPRVLLKELYDTLDKILLVYDMTS